MYEHTVQSNLSSEIFRKDSFLSRTLCHFPFVFNLACHSLYETPVAVTAHFHGNLNSLTCFPLSQSFIRLFCLKREPHFTVLDKQMNILLYIHGCTILYNKIRFSDLTQNTTLEKLTGKKGAILLIYRVATDPLLTITVSHKIYSTNYS